MSSSARNRFIFYAGKLNKLPSSLGSALLACFRLSILRTLFPRILYEPFIPRKESKDDESVHSFLTRRFGAAAAENLGSAVIHGIYAGDSRELSIQAVFPSLVELEREHGALSRALLPRWLNSRYAWEYHKLPQRMPITKEFTERAKGISCLLYTSDAADEATIV